MIRNAQGEEHAELLLVSAVTSILVIRAFLKATGYPQVGGGGLHVAHVLWGGFLMLVAIVLLLLFLNRSISIWASIIGGIGFGTFIDEVGKFLTKDNDYFFQPSIAIIYIVFVLLFVAVRAARGRRLLSEREALANAMHLIEDASQESMDLDTQHHALALLAQSEPGHPLTAPLRNFVLDIRTRPAPRRNWYEATRRALAHTYEQIVAARWFTGVVLLGFVGYGVVEVLSVANSYFQLVPLGSQMNDHPTVRAGLFAATAARAVLIAVAVWIWPRSRLEAYQWFQRAMLVSIFVTQVFVFYESQLAALGGLVVNVATYLVLRYLIRRELTMLPGRAPRA